MHTCDFCFQAANWANYSDTSLFLDETSLFEKFLISFYTAILMLGTNEIGPVNISEHLVLISFLIITSLANAQIFGEMAVLIATIMKKKTMY